MDFLFQHFRLCSKWNLTLTGKYSHTSLPTSPPLRATLALLIGEHRQHPAPIRSPHEQEELRKLRLNPEDARHASDLQRSHGRETTSVSHTPGRISRDLTTVFPAPLGSSGSPTTDQRQSRRLQPQEEDECKSLDRFRGRSNVSEGQILCCVSVNTGHKTTRVLWSLESFQANWGSDYWESKGSSVYQMDKPVDHDGAASCLDIKVIFHSPPPLLHLKKAIQ